MKMVEAIGAAFGTFSRIPVPKSAWTDFRVNPMHLPRFPWWALRKGSS